ncbi:MAG: S8 family serine peptidase [Bacteroidales bacterium]|nr:S8 family serine peptidase [Bacteroidales bacterium]
MKAKALPFKKAMSAALFVLLLSVAGLTNALAQDRNNEDEVVKIDWFNQHATKEGELIVKFADHTTLRLQNNERGFLQTTGINKVDALLKQYPVAKAERLCPNDDPKRELKVSKSYNGPDVVERDLSRLCRFVMEDPMQTYEMIDALKELDEVEFAEPNYMAFALGMENTAPTPFVPYVPYGDKSKGQRDGGSYFNPEAYMAEPMYSLQWGLEAVHLPELWAADTVTTNSDRPVIAILDTGVDIEHPDLAANIWTNPGETDNGYDDDNNGFADDLHGWDFVNQTADMHDFNSHGTHCAGIAAAVGDNGIGITGANPNALIMPIAVLQSNGTGDIATVIQGINYAKNNGADVLSMSFGTYGYSIAFEQALGQAYQNAVLVAAAGNDGKHIDPRCCPDPVHAKMDGPMFPAAFTFVLGVEATQQIPDQCGYLTCWSNYDCDGPTFSQYEEEQLYNYELQAPGAAIYSTVPNGNYRNYSGTSMAAPLVAGGVSALLHAKPYPSQEMLWGDLINTAGNHVNFKACYDAGEAPAQLDFVCMEINDTIGGDGDYRPDAGETICLYPTLRSTWGATNNIMMWLTVDEFEDPDIVTFLDADPVAFGQSLSAYAKSKSANPLRFTIDPDCVDGRIINMVLHLTANPSQYQLDVHFSITVENGVELGGMIMENMTLYPNVHYIVTRPLVIPSSITLTIKPGTILKFKDDTGLICEGHLDVKGTPDSLIVFTKTDLGQGNVRQFSGINDTLEYVKFDGFRITDAFGYEGKFKNCIILNSYCAWPLSGGYFRLSNVFYCEGRSGIFIRNGDPVAKDCNIIFNVGGIPPMQSLKNCNSFNSYWRNRYFSVACYEGATIYVSESPSYFGSNSTDVLHKTVFDFNNIYYQESYTVVDLDSILHQPNLEAHGIVWKVVVNGYDAQDEFDQLPPLGCGTHEFKVYFNRPMDKSVTPFVAMGVRPPYTQHAISENGSWNEEGTIYTAYLTINGSTATDGLNRIYVANAKDNEHFEIPIENVRFNVQVASAGSLSNEFMATPGLGKVDLEWNNNEVDFDDFLGYNMYRYRYDSVYIEGHYDENWNWIEEETVWMPTDSIQLNTTLIQDTVFTDYNVVPGQRYYYYYKVLRTNLTESDASLTVTTVPLTSTPGDANGSMMVDVADVVSIVSYLTNGNPQPFIFEAADVNGDGNIDILDIVGVINIITNRGGLPDANPVATAYYSIENGYLFVDTPVELGGVQFVLNGIDNQSIEALQALEGFEQVKAEVSGGTLFMAYSMSGKRIPAGKHALLRIGEGQINNVALSDPEGHNVLAIFQGTGVEDHETLFLEQPYPNPFNGNLNIPFIIADERANNVVFTVTNIMGQTVSVIELGSHSRGEYKYEWMPSSNMAPGIYTVSMQVNGRMVQHAKVVYVK